jgi:pimeloyl-ACP methyl ester carboxylesterase
VTSPSIQVPRSTIEVGGLHIAEVTAGEGETALVMLHGWGADAGLLWPLAEKLAAKGVRVYVPDLPGFGESQSPPNAWGVQDYVRFALAYGDHHGLERFHLFGHSFGGRLGLILGAEHPGRIEKMVLSNAAGLREAPPLPVRLRLSSYKALRDGLKRVGLGGLSERLRGWYNARYGSTDFQATSGVMRQTFLNVVNADLSDYARQVAVPTLLLWGDQDQDTPLSQGRRLEKLIPDAGMVVYEGAGHYAYLDRLNDAVRVIDFFLKQT